MPVLSTTVFNRFGSYFAYSLGRTKIMLPVVTKQKRLGTHMAELMKVKQLRPRMGNIFIELEVVSIGEPREFASAKGQGKVCNVAGKDETGEVQVSLWNEQIDQVKEGNKIRIENGWVSEYKGQLQLSTGKFGTLHIL